MSRRCARPGCGVQAAATLSYSYTGQAIWIDDLHESAHPSTHDLCGGHADRTTPPQGWELQDRRRTQLPRPDVTLGLRPTG